jgi:hypothetical protein
MKYQSPASWGGASTINSESMPYLGCSGRLGRGFGGDEVCASTSIGGEAGEGRPSRLRRCGRGEGGRRGCSREAREVAVLAGTAHVRGGEGPCAGTVEKAEAICSVCERS